MHSPLHLLDTFYFPFQLRTANASQNIFPDSMRQKPAIKPVGAPAGFHPVAHKGHHRTPEVRRLLDSDTVLSRARSSPRSHAGDSMAATWLTPTSPSSRSAPKNGPKPRGYIPHPPTVASMHSRGRTETRSVHNQPVSARANPSHGNDIMRPPYLPSSKRDSHRGSQHQHGTYRSSSQPPRFSEDPRLADNRRHPHFSPPQSVASLPRREGTSKQSSTDGSIHVMRAPPTSPTLVHQSDDQPVIISLNNGKDGWVIVPPKGRKLQILVTHSLILY